jgi:hypothetical protein
MAMIIRANGGVEDVAGDSFSLEAIGSILGYDDARGVRLPKQVDAEHPEQPAPNRMLFFSSSHQRVRDEALINQTASDLAYEGKPAPPLTIYGDVFVCGVSEYQRGA